MPNQPANQPPAPLQSGDQAPPFELPSTQGTQSLDKRRGEWVVLYFYPKDDTPGCTTEACNFRDALPGMNASVIGVSADDMASHEAFREKYNLPFPLASDEGARIAKAYGTYGDKEMGGKTYTGTLRSTFIIDPEGRVAEAMYNVSAQGHAERVQERLAELQA